MAPHKTLFCLLVLFALIAGACGSSDNDDGPDASAGEPTVEPADEGATDEGADAEPDEPEGDDVVEPPEQETEERIASDIGVTEDTIRIGVLNADLDPLREIGFPLAEALSTDFLLSTVGVWFDRWNEAGGINGRMIEIVPLTWDPLDTATMQDACTKATLDEEVFLVINNSGFNTSFIDCFTVDNDMLFFFGETASQAQIDLAPERLFIMNPPAEVAAEVGSRVIIEDGIIEPGDKVGILSSVGQAPQAAAAAATEVLEAAGHDVLTIEINTLVDDNSAVNAESAAAVSQFSAENVDHVLVLLPFVQAAGFWGEVGSVEPDWERTIIDGNTAVCTPFGASRTDPAAEGSVCVTAYSSYVSEITEGVRPDTTHEAECRAAWIADFEDEFGGRSDPGVPNGEILETADGETLAADYSLRPCSMAYMLEEALMNAGVNPTRDSVAAAMRDVSGPVAFTSNDEGAFGPDKNYFATQMQAVRFTIVDADEPRGPDGTFGGCPAPTNCWVAVTGEWLPVEAG